MSKTPTSAPIGGTKLIIIALALALVAVVLNIVYIETIRREHRRDSFAVYVLTRSVRRGDKLSDRDVKKIIVPRDFKAEFEKLGYVGEDSFETRKDEAVQQLGSEGAIVTYRLYQPVREAILDANIARGKRLVSLPVNSRTLPGALREGMYVDIEAPFHTGGGALRVLPVMERVRVIALGTRTAYDEVDTSGRSRPISGYYSITIEVTPAEATQLAAIERMATEFELHLRNPADDGTPKIKDGGINPEVLALIDSRQREAPAARR